MTDKPKPPGLVRVEYYNCGMRRHLIWLMESAGSGAPYDVALHLTGDFESDEQREAYCEWLAHILHENKHY